MQFATRVLQWYAHHGRHNLPWKTPTSPYRTWISEIMLQQTQVATVIPYFLRFMDTFPTVKALATAPLDHVLHHWSGLGYYARAKNLHSTAQIIVKDFKGRFPRTAEQWMDLPGVGRSTAGAIISQSFNKRAPILDGNVKRVLCRFHGITGWPGNKQVEDKLWSLSETHTPSDNAADYTQAMMDLGATCCTRSHPRCDECPLSSQCYAFKHQQQSMLPEKKQYKALPTKQVHVLIAQTHCGHLLLTQRPLKGLWSGLWIFPEFVDQTSLQGFMRASLARRRYETKPLDPIKHTFSHYHLNILPTHILLNKTIKLNSPSSYVWVHTSQLNERGIPAPVNTLIQTLTRLR